MIRERKKCASLRLLSQRLCQPHEAPTPSDVVTDRWGDQRSVFTNPKGSAICIQQIPIPKGSSTLAQRFNVWVRISTLAEVPKGTAESPRSLHSDIDCFNRGVARFFERARHRLGNAFFVDRARTENIFTRQ